MFPRLNPHNVSTRTPARLANASFSRQGSPTRIESGFYNFTASNGRKTDPYRYRLPNQDDEYYDRGELPPLREPGPLFGNRE